MKADMFSLENRCALITGGGRGLGKAMARALADAGAALFLCSRKSEELQPTAEEIRAATGRRVEWAVADMTNRADVKQMAEAATAALGKVDILINNAGANQPQATDKIEDDVWDRLVELNLTSCMGLTRAVAPGMIERRWGRIIHISSIMAMMSSTNRSAYSATKAALIGMTRSMALDLGPHNITVNSIAPGPFATEMPLTLLNKEQQDVFARQTALGRWGQPEELAGPALLLASDAGSYITGSVIVVDGGAICRLF